MEDIALTANHKWKTFAEEDPPMYTPIWAYFTGGTGAVILTQWYGYRTDKLEARVAHPTGESRPSSHWMLASIPEAPKT